MIRPYRPDDLAAVMDIANRAWQPIYDMFEQTYGPELFAIITPARSTKKGNAVRAHCEQHPDWVYVCEEADGRLSGFVTFHLDYRRRIGEIGNNAVDPDLGLKGRGQQMYRAVFERFEREGMLYAKVSTGLDWAHARARRAYERAGFDIHHEDITYYKRLNPSGAAAGSDGSAPESRLDRAP